MIQMDAHTLQGLRRVEAGARLCMHFAHQHRDEVSDIVPGEMRIHFGTFVDETTVSHGVICEAFLLQLEDGLIPFSLEMRVLVTEKGERYWMALANDWVFACRAELVLGNPQTQGFVSEWELTQDHPLSEWTPFDGGCPLDSTDDWDDLLRKAIAGTSLVHKSFIDRCRRCVEFESLGDHVEISAEVISLMDSIKRRSSGSGGLK
jgi:hypothetical protein